MLNSLVTTGDKVGLVEGSDVGNKDVQVSKSRFDDDPIFFLKNPKSRLKIIVRGVAHQRFQSVVSYTNTTHNKHISMWY